MANRTYLCALNSDVLEDNELDAVALLEARYCIPLLWLSLFQMKDVTVHNKAPLLLTSKEAAIANWTARRDGISRFLGEPSADIIAGWDQFIHSQSASNFLINTHELWLMDEEEGQLTTELGRWFSDLDDMTTSDRPARDLAVVIQADRRLCCFPYIGDAMHLCGNSMGSDLPWPEKTGKPDVFVLDTSSFLIEEVVPSGRPLNVAIKELLSRARGRHLRPFACVSANWCTPCLEMFALFSDPRLAPTLDGIHLLKLDLEQWDGEFEGIGIDGMTSVPHLAQLNAEGMGTGRMIDGNAWDDSTPDELSQALGPFFNTAGH